MSSDANRYGSPPFALMRHRIPRSANTNRLSMIEWSDSHVIPAMPSPPPVLHRMTGRPPSTEIFMSTAPDSNAIHLPSGENSGYLAPVVPASTWGRSSDSNCTYSWLLPVALAIYAIRRPSGEREMVVAMDDAAAMRIVQRGGRVLNDAHGFANRQLAVTRHPRPDCFAFNVRHHIEHEAVCGSGIVEQKDIGVLQVRCGANLGQETFGTEYDAKFRMQHVECNASLVLEIVGKIHRGHSAVTDLAYQMVPTRQCFIQCCNHVHIVGTKRDEKTATAIRPKSTNRQCGRPAAERNETIAPAV